LPSLDPGLTLLDIEAERPVPIIQSLVLEHLLTSEGLAHWVDARGHATTTGLARLAPSRRLLDRIQVVRGFTASQHYAALRELPDRVCDPRRSDRESAVSDPGNTARASSTARTTPALLVVPAFDAQYRDTDTLARDHVRTLQARGIACLAGLVHTLEVPVLVTRTSDDAFTDPLDRAADHHLRCEQTRMGPRFVGEDHETLCYPAADGYQTTFAYWRQLLGRRAQQAGIDTTSSPQASAAPGQPVAGTTASTAHDPLLDVWTTAGGAGGQ
jgi:hypothetical protein